MKQLIVGKFAVIVKYSISNISLNE